MEIKAKKYTGGFFLFLKAAGNIYIYNDLTDSNCSKET